MPADHLIDFDYGWNMGGGTGALVDGSMIGLGLNAATGDWPMAYLCFYRHILG